MKKEAVLHIPLSQYAYAEDEHTLVIRIRTGKNDIQKCSLYYGDRVDPAKEVRMKKADMKKTASDDIFDYFEARISDRYTRVCYYFLLDDGQEKQYFYGRGFGSRMACSRTEYFQFPYIRREDICDIPEWAKEAVMYHIFPDSFASGKRSLNGRGKQVFCRDARSVCKLGGTLNGIRENVDYLKEMGINCIYLNPVFAANSYHKYDTIDYFEVDPCFGTKEDLKALVKCCHENGIRVLLDGVFNHCGPDFFAFRDVMENGEKSNYYSWFYYMPVPVCYQDPPNYEAFAYVKEMPKLNTGNPKTADYLCRVGTYWIKEADIDGWRLDVANEIDHDFWRKFRKAVRAVKKDCFLIAEIWEDSQVWLMGDQFDSSMNYVFSYLCRDFFAERKITASEFDQQIQKMLLRYPEPVSRVQMNFLDSHDIARFFDSCGGAAERLRLAFFYLFMSVGIPSVFYGDECCLAGREESEYRAAMDWECVREKRSVDLSVWIRLRKNHKALTHGDYQTVGTDDAKGIYLFCRSYQDERILVCLNNSDQAQAVDEELLSGWKQGLTDLCTGEKIGESLEMEAMSGRVFISY